MAVGAGPGPGAGATDCTGSLLMGLAAGFVIGAIATVVMVNVTGEKSISGLARKTIEYGKATVGKLHV